MESFITFFFVSSSSFFFSSLSLKVVNFFFVSFFPPLSDKVEGLGVHYLLSTFLLYFYRSLFSVLASKQQN